MPDLDAVSIVALASFMALVVAWLLAPMETATVVSVSRRTETERAAA